MGILLMIRYIVGDIEGSKSKQRHPLVVNKPQLQLITKDIEKCYTNSCYDGFVKVYNY